MTETTEEKSKSTSIAIAAGPRGLQLNTFGEMWSFATAVSKSGMAPKGLEKVESIVTAMQLGAELGMGPMTAIQNIAVINGRPTVWGDVMLGLCMDSGLFDEEAFSERMTGDPNSIDRMAVCTCRRLGGSEKVVQGFSVRDAKRAGLWDKRGRNNEPMPWQQYPQRMLQMRARSWALRDAFPDVLKGIYSGEEARDIVVEAVPSDDHLAQAREAREADAAEIRKCVICGNRTPFVGATFCGAKCWAAFKTQAQEAREAEEDLTSEAAVAVPATASQRKMMQDSIDKGLAPPEPVPDPDATPEEPVPDPEPPEPTSESEESTCNARIEAARFIHQLTTWEGWVESHGILTDEAKKRLYLKIAARKAIIRGSRGSRSNVPSD